MRKLGESINELMAALAAGDDASRKAQRAAAVNVAWRNAVEAVYKDAAQMVLDHVNAVYIMAADEVVKGTPTRASHAGTGAQLVVYADDSLIRSDLDARQEFLKMKLKEQGEHVETFKTVSYTHLDVYKRQVYTSTLSRPNVCTIEARIVVFLPTESARSVERPLSIARGIPG